MLVEHFITPDEYAEAVNEEIVLAPRRPTSAAIRAPWYLDHVRRILERYYGGAASQLGLTVHTAVDLGLQQAAEDTLRQGLRELAGRQPFRGAVRRLPEAEVVSWTEGAAPSCRADGRCEAVVTKVRQSGLAVQTADGPAVVPSWTLLWRGETLGVWRFRRGDVLLLRRTDAGLTLDEDPAVEGAMAVMEPSTGYVKAIVGGYDYGAASSTAPPRRSGSPARRSSRCSTPRRSTTGSHPRRASSTPPSRSGAGAAAGARRTMAASTTAAPACAKPSPARSTPSASACSTRSGSPR